MRAVVIYESMFGNTKEVAEAVAEGLGSGMSTSVHECGSAPTTITTEIDLLVVGAPTHAFGLPRPTTRASAREKTSGPVVSQGSGLREWLEAFSLEWPVAVAAFDTRVSVPRLPGSAAVKALRRLRTVGGRPVGEPHTFDVLGMTGPLAEGELDRARRWGADLGATVTGGGESRPRSGRPRLARSPAEERAGAGTPASRDQRHWASRARGGGVKGSPDRRPVPEEQP